MVQKAMCLSRANSEPHVQAIGACTTGVIFMGTPHNGSDLAAWASLAARMISPIKDVNKSILQTLERECEGLRDVQDAFGQLVLIRQREGSRIEMTCFFEELAVTGVNKVRERRNKSFDRIILSFYRSFRLHRHVSSAATRTGYTPITW